MIDLILDRVYEGSYQYLGKIGFELIGTRVIIDIDKEINKKNKWRKAFLVGTVNSKIDVQPACSTSYFVAIINGEKLNFFQPNTQISESMEFAQRTEKVCDVLVDYLGLTEYSNESVDVDHFRIGLQPLDSALPMFIRYLQKNGISPHY